MTRKDSEKDADRPHYYSQFWLDIAAGRRVIGGPKPEEAEAGEIEAPEPAPVRKAGRASASDGYKETRASAVVEPEVEEEEFEQEEAIDEAEMPNIVLDEDVEPVEEELAEDYSEEEELEEEEFFDEEEEEDEEDEGWGRRGGRKKAKPTRPVKPVKKPRREPRRGF